MTVAPAGGAAPPRVGGAETAGPAPPGAATAPAAPSAPPVERRAGLPSRVVSAKVRLRDRLTEIWGSRELIVFLVRKELKIRYKNSVLGFLWSFLNPALILGVYYVVFKYFLPNHLTDFAIYLFAGLLPWNLFNNSMLSSAGVLVAHAGIVKKVAFPREILALAQVGTALCYFFFQTCILVLFLLAFRVSPAWSYLPIALYALVADIVLCAGLSIFLSAVNVYLRDVQHFVEILLVALFFSPPIVYPFTNISSRLDKPGHVRLIPGTHFHLLGLYLLNPLATIVLSFQRLLYGTVHQPAGVSVAIPSYGPVWYLVTISVVLVVGIAVCFGAMIVFGRVEGNFAEEL